MEKFGSVYLAQHDARERDISPPSKLEGICFSNWDHQWYSENSKEKQVHPQFESHRGKPFYVEMKLKTRYGTTGHDGSYTGHLLCPFGVGEILIPDVESIQREDQNLLEYLKDLKIFQEFDDPLAIRLEKFHSAAFVCFMASRQKLDNFRGLIQFFPLTIIFDDFLEEHMFYSYSELNVVKHAFHEILNMRDVDWSQEKYKIRRFQPEEENNYFNKILAYIRSQSQMIMRERKLHDSSPLIERYLEYYDSMMLQNCCEWIKKHDKKSQLYRHLEEDLRKITISALVWLEFILLEKGVCLNQEIRNTFLVKKFYELIGQQTGRVNDIFSFYKEICKGEIGGTLYLLHVTDGLPVEECLKRVIEIDWTHAVVHVCEEISAGFGIQLRCSE